LTASSLAPVTGSIVTIAARVDVGRSESAIGSFVGTVSFDPRALVFVGVDTAVAGPSAIVHVDRGVAKAVGAAPNGFGDRLFALRFRVLGAAAIRSLVLQITELNDVHFGSALPHLRVDTRVYAAAAQ